MPQLPDQGALFMQKVTRVGNFLWKYDGTDNQRARAELQRIFREQFDDDAPELDISVQSEPRWASVLMHVQKSGLNETVILRVMITAILQPPNSVLFDIALNEPDGRPVDTFRLSATYNRSGRT